MKEHPPGFSIFFLTFHLISPLPSAPGHHDPKHIDEQIFCQQDNNLHSPPLPDLLYLFPISIFLPLNHQHFRSINRDEMNDDKLRSLFASLATLTQQGPIPGENFRMSIS